VLLLVGCDDYTEADNEHRPVVAAGSSTFHVEFPTTLPDRKLLFVPKKYYLGPIEQLWHIVVLFHLHFEVLLQVSAL
jgi:hypothetical protein